MSLLSRILQWMSGNPASQQPSRPESDIPTELAAQEKILKTVKFIESVGLCENAAFLINEHLGTEFGDFTLSKLKGTDPDAKKLAPREWLKVDSVIRLQKKDGKLLEMVIMELSNWAEFSRDDSQSGDFFIRHGGELVLECRCTRSVIDMGGTRAVSIDCNSSSLQSFSNGEWVGLLSSAALEGQRLKEKWKKDGERAQKEQLIGRADRMKL